MDGPLWTVGTTRSVGVLLFGPREVFCGADRAAFSYLLPGILSYPRYTTGHREAPMDPRNYHHHHHHHHQEQQQQQRRLRSFTLFHSRFSFFLSLCKDCGCGGHGTSCSTSIFTEESRGKFYGREGTHEEAIANRGSKLILDPGIRLARFE